MNDNNMNNELNNINPNINNDNSQINNINLNNEFWNNDVNQNNMNNNIYNQNIGNSNVINNQSVNNNFDNVNSINQVQRLSPQMMNAVQDMGMGQAVNNNVVSNQDMNNNQNINVAENFLNVIKDNTNDTVMIDNSMDMSNNGLGNNEAVADTFNMNNIDVSQINNNIQPELNNINQVQEINNFNQVQNVNSQMSDVVQDIEMNQQVNNVVDSQNIIQNDLNVNDINVNDNFNKFNMINNIDNNPVGNNLAQNVAVDNFNNSQVNDINNQNVNNVQDNNINSNVDEELVRFYVGEKYDKIKNSSFSIPTFFLGSLYLFYRKMYLYGWLMMLLGPLAFVGYIIFAIKFKDIYIKHVNKKVNKIKLKNSNLSNEELKNICSKKGGTSIGMVFLNLFGVSILLIIIVSLLMLILGTSLLLMFKDMLSNVSVEINPQINNTVNVIEDENFSSSLEDTILLENVNVNGYWCMGNKCNLSTGDVNNSIEYEFSDNNAGILKIINDYNDYLKIYIYYIQKDDSRMIVNYKIFIKSSNEDISNIKTEEELRIKLGLYALGTHTADLTLKKIGMLGAGFNENNESYSYITYTFVNDKNVEYKMNYINPDETLDLVEGNKYNVTFEVTEGTFDYEYTIKNIK